MLANKVVDDYIGAYISWQKDMTIQFVAKTSLWVDQVVFLNNFETQEIVDEQKKVCRELKTVVEIIDKGTNPTKMGEHNYYCAAS